MPYPRPFVAQSAHERSLVERAKEAARVAAEHAARHDREGTFPEEGLRVLAENGYLAAVVPEDCGGEGASLSSYVLADLELARGDASLALVVAMHVALLGRARDHDLWPRPAFERVARDVAERRSGHGALINSLATEPEMGSPSRGALPRTRAVKQPDGTYRLSGRKTFSSGAPVLRWATVSATVGEGAGAYVATFLVPLFEGRSGLRIEPSWDTLGMRATNSHTLVLEDVAAPADAELPRPRPSGDERPPVPHEKAWGLSWAAVYLGVAEAARDFAVEYARNRRPTNLGGQSIGSVPQIRRRIGELDLALYQARGLLVSTARAWDEADEDTRRDLDSALGAAKMTVTNTAVQVAEGAMRVVGGTSLDRSLPIERHYRDVRGGLHHPPQEDAVFESLAHDALD